MKEKSAKNTVFFITCKPGSCLNLLKEICRLLYSEFLLDVPLIIDGDKCFICEILKYVFSLFSLTSNKATFFLAAAISHEVNKQVEVRVLIKLGDKITVGKEFGTLAVSPN